MRNIYLSFILFILGCDISNEHDLLIDKEGDYFNAIEKNDIKLSAPKEGDWLFEHKESPQTFQKYRLQNPTTLNDSQNVIYLQPIGQFTDLQKKAFALTREYVSIFFQTKTVLLPEKTDSLVPEKSKRIRVSNNVQLLAPYILDTMITGLVPKNSIAYMAFTSKDLFPKNDWNYVFGLASYNKRVGVSSIYRLQNKKLDSANFTICLKRLINVSSHEIGHMFTISHCTFAKCAMNGSNGLHETDLSPNRLCSECQKKLYWNIKYDNKKRLNELISFFKTNNLKKDYQYLQLDFQSLQ